RAPHGAPPPLDRGPARAGDGRQRGHGAGGAPGGAGGAGGRLARGGGDRGDRGRPLRRAPPRLPLAAVGARVDVSDADAPRIEDDPAEERFVARVGEHLAWLTYARMGDRLYL